MQQRIGGEFVDVPAVPRHPSLQDFVSVAWLYSIGCVYYPVSKLVATFNVVPHVTEPFHPLFPTWAGNVKASLTRFDILLIVPRPITRNPSGCIASLSHRRHLFTAGDKYPAIGDAVR